MKNRDLILAGVIAIAVLLNIAIFYMAYPAVFQASLPRGNQVGHDGNFSMPFSAYYEGAWRVIHDPANVYSRQNSSSDYPLRYPPQQYKYTPSFLLIMLPLVRLSYSSAFLLFDGIQLALLPVLGFFVFQLIRGKRLLLSIPASVIVLLAPLPAIPWGEYTQATVNSVASSL